MNAGNLWFLIKLLPLLAATATLFTLFGWWLRKKHHAPATAKPANPTHKPSTPDDLPARERVKKLENALAKSETAQKSLKHDLETLQAKSVSKTSHEKTTRELADAQHRLETDQKRILALESELKKARDTINTLNSNAAEANKGQRERTFALENELSKTREALTLLQSRPDNSLALQAEVDRLREALTNSTRVIGELRRQEAAAVESMTKAQKQLEAALAKSPPQSEPLSSVANAFISKSSNQSTKAAEAKAEVERLIALNAQKEAEREAAEKQAAAEQAAAEQAAAEQAERERLAANPTQEEPASPEASPIPAPAAVQTDLFAAVEDPESSASEPAEKPDSPA